MLLNHPPWPKDNFSDISKQQCTKALIRVTIFNAKLATVVLMGSRRDALSDEDEGCCDAEKSSSVSIVKVSSITRD